MKRKKTKKRSVQDVLDNSVLLYGFMGILGLVLSIGLFFLLSKEKAKGEMRLIQPYYHETEIVYTQESNRNGFLYAVIMNGLYITGGMSMSVFFLVKAIKLKKAGYSI